MTCARAAARFLVRYVAADGRVIRRDQGGDVVSEGQAYGMLLAHVAGRPALVRTIWSWTDDHLRRADNLFAWRASGTGRIADPQAATDADVLIAYALLRYSGTGEAALHRAGRRTAAAVLDHESVALPDGSPLLVAGPWARETPAPTVNPSYLMPGVLDAVGRLTGDPRWHRAAAAGVAMIGRLTHGGTRLPPDWAILTGGRLAAVPRPGGGMRARYGADAARVPIWFGAARDRRARRLAASWWRHALRRDRGRAPVDLLARAAAATAAGDLAAAAGLRSRAAAAAHRTPGYYGDAWAALGPALLDRAIDPARG